MTPVPPSADRGRGAGAYTLITPENHYVSRLPDLPGAYLVKLVTPRLFPARLAEYLLRAPEAELSCRIDPELEHFLYGLDGGPEVSDGATRFELADEGFCYVPAGGAFTVRMPTDSALLWIKRRYEPWPGLDAPAARGGHARALPPTATATPGLARRELLPPADGAYDFNMSLMSFDPGVGLPQIEIHDEEHGLYMTAGGGLYRLGEEEHAVNRGDFIYMAPYCPQGFLAGEQGGEYLLYKDVYRDAF